ncbi:hypothetical protein AAE02nite_32030 [Adhaeribacter aerolatus]|uniref:Uncharacterized protein n=1 Tax=Adhaeribacter aerolatus TaxID=670289 RepID=A0A512B0Q5_9BACT|nr:hypothetical protein [Adhaeribacter aerolatus]GEO05539.1 hypothetical protein AAE02nite_32030 [Adhaeribacter aerolatus]
MKEVIKKYIPNIISESKLSEAELEDAFIKYRTRLDSLVQIQNSPDKPHCLFDWVLLAKRGDEKAISFLMYLESEVFELLERTEQKFHNQIRGTIKKIVSSIDTNVEIPNNPKYLNFIGEIVGLNHIIYSAGERFKLKAIEQKMPNPKRADFVFYDKELDDEIYVDFVSIHNIDTKKLSNDDDLISFLEGRFNRKLESKTPNLDENFHRIKLKDGKEVNFAILPLIWTEICDLIPFKSAFKKIDNKYANVFSCLSLLPQLFDDGTITYNICRVSDILDCWKEQINT